MDRRTWLEAVLKLSGLGIVGVLATSAIANIISPIFERRRGEVWKPLGLLDDFPVGEVSKAIVELSDDATGSRSLQEKGVFVWRKSAEEVIVYSRNCTDLSCPVTWDEGSGWFYCPCHGGIFTQQGDPVAGPPSRPLYRYATRERDGVLEIELNSLPPMT